MKRKGIYLLTALAMAVGICAARPMVSGAVQVNKDCSLTVFPEDPDKSEMDRFGGDLADAQVVTDLYYVAKAVERQGYDTYSFEPADRYGGLQIPDAPSAEDWESLAQQAARIALGDAGADTPVKSGAAGEKISPLKAGLYLLIARGADLTSAADYRVETTQEDPLTGETVTRISTVAYSEQYRYTFAPRLIALPSRAADENGGINTANPGEWDYDLTVNLKPERSPRYGSLEIVKTLSSYETEKGGKDPVTFVFEVTGVLGGKQVYSDVESITFTAAGRKSVILDRIPALAVVTIREVYGGSAYELTVSGDRTAVIPANDIVSVEFENIYDGHGKNGHGIKNQFVYEENGGWRWYSDPAQPVNGNQGLPPAGGQGDEG